MNNLKVSKDGNTRVVHVKQKRWPYLVVVLILFFGVFQVFNKPKERSLSASPVIKTTENPHQTYREENNITWLIGSNKIVFQYIQAPPGSDTPDIMQVTAEGYPDLFKNLDYNAIKIIPIKTPQKVAYLIANEFYQGAGYTLDNAIILDISNGETLYKTSHPNTQGWFHNLVVKDNGEIFTWVIYSFYDFCRSCGYYIGDYLIYSGDNKGYVTHNSAHKEEFRKILSDITSKNHCAVTNGGQQMTFDEIKGRYGEDYRCKSSSSSIDMDGISPKEYFLLKSKVERIIKGEEVSLLDL